MQDKPIVKVIVALIQNSKGEILLLHRSDRTKWAPNLWNVVSGKIEENEEPVKAAFREIDEETKLNVELKDSFPMYDVPYEGTIWRTWAFIFKTIDIEPILNNEHQGFEWTSLDSLSSFDLVPILEIDLKEMNYL